MSTDIAFPAQLPVGKLAGHVIDAVDISERTIYEAGEQRVRRLFTIVPQKASVSWFLSQEHFDIFDDWYENTLLAGSFPFDVQVAGEGVVGVVWYTANFITPYTMETVATRWGPMYRIGTSLLLMGESFGSRVATSLYSTIGFRIGLNAALFGAPVALRSAIRADLSMRPVPTVPSAGLHSEFDVSQTLRGTLS